MPDSIVFNKSEPLTLGVEVELQLLDPQTFDLSPAALKILEGETGSQIKAELFQSMLEVNTPICDSVFDVRSNLQATFQTVLARAQRAGVLVASAGTHPFADYRDRLLFPDERYENLFLRKQWIARRLQIFGLHVHVGMRNGDHAIQMNNALLHYLPLLLALSASSPFCEGEDTMLASSRTTFFEASPVAGHPCFVHSWDEFVELAANMRRAGAIKSLKDVWWDIRPSPDFGTIEIRVCDSPPTLSEICSLVALIHSICIYIDQQIQDGRRFAPPPLWILRENKWRAARYGQEASLILTNDGQTQTLSETMSDLLNELRPIINSRGYQYFVEPYRTLNAANASYNRQRKVFQQSHGDLTAVSRGLVKEFESDILRIPLSSVKRAL